MADHDFGDKSGLVSLVYTDVSFRMEFLCEFLKSFDTIIELYDGKYR